MENSASSSVRTYNLTHRVGILAPAKKVVQTLSTIDGLAAWWTRDTTGTSKVGGVIDFVFKQPSGEILGAMSMEVTHINPKQVIWRCVSGPPEWINTDIVFDITREAPYTIVMFSHQHWTEPTEFMAHCNMKWGTFLMSLKNLLETGQGRPSPDDVKIDSWN